MTAHRSLPHLARHHRDFASFRDTMIQTSATRFDETFWAIFDTHIASALGSTDLFVDFGTGPGNFLQMLAERYNELRLVGIDCQPEMLVSARQVVDGLGDSSQVIEADLMHAPITELGEHTAGAALSSMLLHELEVPTVLFREARRVLRPGGKLLVYDWVRHPLRRYVDAIDMDVSLEQQRDMFHHFSEHCRYTTDDYVFLGEQAGFRILDTMILKRGRRVVLVMQAP